MSKIMLATLGGIIAVVLLASGLRLLFRPPPDGNAPKLIRVQLRLKWLHQAQFSGFYCAAENGFYSDEGLDVSIQSGGENLNAIQSVNSGSDQFGVWGAEQLLIARSQGISVKAIGVIYKDTAACFMVKESSGIRNFKDFEGKRVGIQRGTDLDTLYNALTSIKGVDRQKIQEIPVNYNRQLFIEDKVQVWPSYEVNEPYLMRQEGVRVKILSPRDAGLRFYGDTIFCRDDFIKNNPETVRKFLKATKRGWEYAMKHPDEASAKCLLYDKRLNLEHQRDMLMNSIPLIFPPNTDLFRMTDSDWTKIHDVLKTQKLIDREVSVAEIYTNEYLP